MTMLQRQPGHAPCRQHIQRYLEWDKGRDRAVARAVVNIARERADEWALVMDETREESGQDEKAYHGKRAVRYQHYVLSPDPRDEATPEDVEALAREWCREFFGDELGPGRLGMYQQAIVLHDDNSSGVLHAHVIVNCTDLASGRRLQVSNADNDALWDRLQDISREMGMRALLPAGEFRAARRSRDAEELARFEAKWLTSGVARYRTKVERAIRGAKGYSWKDGLADMIDVSRSVSRDEDEFLEALADLRVDVYRRGADYVYAHPANPDTRRCTGRRLGAAYTRTAVLAQIERAGSEGEPVPGPVRENVLASARELVERIMAHQYDNSYGAGGSSLADAAWCMQVNRIYGISSLGQYDEAMERLEAHADVLRAAGESSLAERLEARKATLLAAQEIASRGGFFEHVGDEPWNDPRSRVPMPPNPARRTANGKAAHAESQARKPARKKGPAKEDGR